MLMSAVHTQLLRKVPLRPRLARKIEKELGCGASPAPHLKALFLIHEMATAVLLPTGLVRFSAERLLFAVADGLDIAGADPSSHQRALHGAGTAVAQSQVVLGGSALVAVSLNREVDVGMLLQESDIRLHRTLLVPSKIGFVVIEVDVLDVLREQLLLGRPGCGRRWWRRRRSHGHPCGCLLSAAGSLRGQRVGGRVGRSRRLRAAGLHRSNAVDAHVGGIAGLPAERGGLALLNAVGTRRQRGRRRWWRRWRWWWWRWCLLMAGAEKQNGA